MIIGIATHLAIREVISKCPTLRTAENFLCGQIGHELVSWKATWERGMAERDGHRRRRRAEALRRYADEYAQAGRVLRQVYEEGERLRSQIAIRRCLVLRRVAQAEPSAEPEPSPASGLITQKGWALHLYLMALFEAQCRRRPRGVIRNVRPLRSTDRQSGWIDFLPATTATANRSAGMMRQATRALTLLSGQGLVKLNGRPGTAGRFERFQLLRESGSLYGGVWSHVLYSIPASDARMPPSTLRPPAAKAGRLEALQLPAGFFLRGWVHVLSAAEIVTYLMIRELETEFPGEAKTGVYVNQPNREAWYGLSRDVYESHRQLTQYGLIERLNDPNRGTDGKILRQPAGTKFLQALRFRTVPTGLDQPALKTVTAALTKA